MKIQKKGKKFTILTQILFKILMLKNKTKQNKGKQ